MKTNRMISSALAVTMLMSGTALPASAENVRNDNIFTASAFSETGALSKPKITGAATGARNIKLKWSRVKGATGYKVYRKTKTGTFKCIKTIKGGSVTAVKIGGFDSSTKYTFKIRAFKKKSGKTTFSSYSAAKSFKTKYGLGKSNYTDKAFSLKFNKDLWSFSEGSFLIFDDGVLFSYEYDPNIGGSVTYENWQERGEGRDLEYFAEEFIDDEKNMYHPTYYKIEYGEAFGEKAAYIWLVGEDPDLNPDTPAIDPCPMIMIYENNILYYINSYYPRNAEDPEKCNKILNKVFSTLKLTYNNF